LRPRDELEELPRLPLLLEPDEDRPAEDDEPEDERLGEALEPDEERLGDALDPDEGELERVLGDALDPDEGELERVLGDALDPDEGELERVLGDALDPDEDDGRLYSSLPVRVVPRVVLRGGGAEELPSSERVDPLERVGVLPLPERELAPLDTSRPPEERVVPRDGGFSSFVGVVVRDPLSPERVVVRESVSPERVVVRESVSPERVVVRPVGALSPERVVVRVDAPVLPERVVERVVPSSSVRVVVRVVPREVEVPAPEPLRVTERRPRSSLPSRRAPRPRSPRRVPDVERRPLVSRLPRPLVEPRGS